MTDDTAPAPTVEQVRALSQLASLIARNEIAAIDAFQHILSVAIGLTGSDFGSIHLLDSDKSILRPVAFQGAPAEPLMGSVYPIHGSVSGMAVRTRRPVIIGDITEAAEYVQVFAEVRSELVVPLIVSDDVVGVVNLESKHPNHFTAGQLSLVELAASLLGAALKFAQLAQTRSQHLEELEEDDAVELVFVLMPFREPFNKYYTSILKPAVKAAGMRALRSDEIFGPSEIMRDLWGSLQNARIVLAELTGRNPNVMYEVGLAHGIGKPVVLVAQSIEDVPFDLRGLRCVLYDTTDPDWANRLRDGITKSLRIPHSVTGPFKAAT